MLTTLAVEGYRSLRHLVVPLAAVTVITGANGTGKSSLYRSLRLLAAAGRDGAVAALAREGGLPSTLWAGPESIGRAQQDFSIAQGTVRRGPVALKLGFSGDGFGYAMDLGLPVPSAKTMFVNDPEIKAESVWSGPVLRPSALLSERRGGHVRIRDGDQWHDHERTLPSWASMLDEVADARRAPELLALRDELRGWRFYDALRTDQDAPARGTSIATRTPVLSADGNDLAATLRTIQEQGHAPDLDSAIEAAFPGSRIDIEDHSGRLSLLLHQRGLLRPLESGELSDGTLRYLLWVAALLSQRPAPLLVLNEPETSLHPSLLGPLADLIATAAARSQILVVSHSAEFVDRLAARDAIVHELEKAHGESRLVGQGLLDAPPWNWPTR